MDDKKSDGLFYKVKKVFVCQTGMPGKVKKDFFDCNEYLSPGNDTYVDWIVQDQEKNNVEERKLVDDWLIANGAVSGEIVIIKHWW